MAADVVELADFFTDLPRGVEWIEDGNSVHGDDSVIYANKDSSKRRISDDTTSSSDTSQGESLDFKKLQQLGDDGEPSTASGLDSHSTVSALRRTKKKQMRHCDSEICLTDLVGM